MTSTDIFNNFFPMISHFPVQPHLPHSNCDTKNSATMQLGPEENQETDETNSNDCQFEKDDVQNVKEEKKIIENVNNKTVKENGYDIKSVLSNEVKYDKKSLETESPNEKTIKCYCEEEFANILDFLSHLKSCEKKNKMKCSPFLQWISNSYSYQLRDSSALIQSDQQLTTEALDLSKKSPIPTVDSDASDKLSNLMEADYENVRWGCPECKFICSKKNLLLEHFDCEHKETGSFSCTCGHLSEWLPAFLRHYITCKIAATDLQEDKKDDGLLKGHNHFNSMDIENITKLSTSQTFNSRLFHNRPQENFNLIPNLSQQFFSNWLDPRTMDMPLPLTKCPWCQRNFPSVSDLSNHVNQCSVRPILKTFEKPFTLDFLKSNQFSFSHSSLPITPFSDRHLPPTSNSVSSVQNEPARHFKCSHCIKSFKSKALLDQHMHIHYPPKYTCRYCGKKYRWPPVFYHHQRTCKKRPTASSASNTVSSNGTLNTNSTCTSISMASNGFNTNNGTTNQNSFPAQNSMTIPPPKVSPPNLILNGSPPFLQNPLLNLPSKLPFQNHHSTTHSVTCICTQRFESFPQYFTHISFCPLFLHMTSKSRVDPLHPANPMNLKPHNTAAEHNPFLNPNGFLFRPPIQNPFLPPGLSVSALKSKMSPPISSQANLLQSNCIQSTDFQHTLTTPKSTPFLPDAFSLNMNNTAVAINSEPNICSIFKNTENNSSNLASPVNTFNHLLSQDSSRLSLQANPAFSPSFHAHHHHFGIGKSCNQCGKEFSSRLSLKQHIEGKHSAEGKYQCPSCSKRYRWGASYYYHKKSCIVSKDSTSSPNPSPPLTEILFD